jgi:hypothetical protein
MSAELLRKEEQLSQVKNLKKAKSKGVFSDSSLHQCVARRYDTIVVYSVGYLDSF